MPPQGGARDRGRATHGAVAEAAQKTNPPGARTRLTIRRDSDTSLFIFNPQKMSAQHQVFNTEKLLF